MNERAKFSPAPVSAPDVAHEQEIGLEPDRIMLAQAKVQELLAEAREIIRGIDLFKDENGREIATGDAGYYHYARMAALSLKSHPKNQRLMVISDKLEFVFDHYFSELLQGEIRGIYKLAGFHSEQISGVPTNLFTLYELAGNVLKDPYGQVWPHIQDPKVREELVRTVGELERRIDKLIGQQAPDVDIASPGALTAYIDRVRQRRKGRILGATAHRQGGVFNKAGSSTGAMEVPVPATMLAKAEEQNGRYGTDVFPAFDIREIDPEWVASKGKRPRVRTSRMLPYQERSSVEEFQRAVGVAVRQVVQFMKVAGEKTADAAKCAARGVGEGARWVAEAGREALGHKSIGKAVRFTREHIWAILTVAGVAGAPVYCVRSKLAKQYEAALSRTSQDKDTAIANANGIIQAATKLLKLHVETRSLLPGSYDSEIELKIDPRAYQLDPKIVGKADFGLDPSEEDAESSMPNVQVMRAVSIPYSGPDSRNFANVKKLFIIKGEESFLISLDLFSRFNIANEAGESGNLYFLFSQKKGRFRVIPIFLFHNRQEGEGSAPHLHPMTGKVLEGTPTELNDPDLVKSLEDLHVVFQDFRRLKSEDPRLDSTRPSAEQVLASGEFEKKLLNNTVRFATRSVMRVKEETGFKGFVVAPDAAVISVPAAAETREKTDPKYDIKQRKVMAGVDYFVTAANGTVDDKRLLANPHPSTYSIWWAGGVGIIAFNTPVFKKMDGLKISADPLVAQPIFTLQPCDEQYSGWRLQNGVVQGFHGEKEKENALEMAVYGDCSKGRLFNENMPIVNVEGEVVSLVRRVEGFRENLYFGPPMHPDGVEELRKKALEKFQKKR